MANTPITDFLRESLQRLRTRSPKFFKILQVVAAVLTFAGYVPTMLRAWFSVSVPDNIVSLCEDVRQYSAGFFAAALLPVTSPIVGVTPTGDLLKATNPDKLPFTAKAEQVAADKADEKKL